MAFLRSLDIAGSALTAQKRRLDTIAENIANRETTRTDAGGPYRRKLTVFREITGRDAGVFPSQRQSIFRGGRSDFGTRVQELQQRTRQNHGGVMVSEVIEDESPLVPVYDPAHPDANEDGYVMMPNVNSTMEMTDAMAASRSFSANVAAFEAIKMMANQALELGKR